MRELIELKHVMPFQKSINAVASFISEGNFRFNNNGLTFKATDPSQIVLISLSMPKSAFDKYSIEPTLIGLDLVELNKIVSRALPNDKMVLDISEAELKLKLEGDLDRAFNIPLIDVSDEEVEIPSPKFDAKITINARILKEALKDASLFGSSVVLRVKGNQFIVEARGSQGTLHTETKQTSSIVVKTDSEVVSKFSLNFLQNIVREAENESKVVMEMKGDSAMKVSYKLGNAELEFLLAHMIL